MWNRIRSALCFRTSQNNTETDPYTAFAKKHWLLTWALELTKSWGRGKPWHCCLHFCVCLGAIHLAVTLGYMKDRTILQHLYKEGWKKLPQGRGQPSPAVQNTTRQQGLAHPDQIALFKWRQWQQFSKTLSKAGHTCNWDGWTLHTFVPCPKFFFYLNLKLILYPAGWMEVLTFPLPLIE
jgi:hypothetical protein